MNEVMAEEPMVLAVISGKPFTELPRDLFIPPDALEVLLDSFTGPLDLLLYLIREQNIDILDIPMAKITEQYMQYIEWLEMRRLELAADYLVMAALLIEIKSRLLLPRTECLMEIEEDPRMELVRRLQLYEQFKCAADLMDSLPRQDRDVFQLSVSTNLQMPQKALPSVGLDAIKEALMNVLSRQKLVSHHHVTRELLSVREKMTSILQKLKHQKLIEFVQFLQPVEGRMGLVVTLLAVLELARQSLVVLIQREPHASIYLQAPRHG